MLFPHKRCLAGGLNCRRSKIRPPDTGLITAIKFPKWRMFRIALRPIVSDLWRLGKCQCEQVPDWGKWPSVVDAVHKDDSLDEI